MKITTPVCGLLIMISLTGCIRNAYFLSPLNGNNHPYRTLPMVSDSLHHSTYFHSSFSAGGANDDASDGVVSFQSSVYQAHTFQNVQFYYGVTGTLGNYHINSNSFYEGPGINNTVLKGMAGDKFFAGAGGIAGLDFVVPFESGGEWRVFGVETSIQKEFGEYLSFRNKVPDSTVNGIDRKNVYATLAFGTNIIKKFRRSGNTFGYKLAYVTSTRSIHETDGQYKLGTFRPGFLSNTFHLTKKRVTGFAQFNVGNYVANLQFGMNYRL